MDNPTPRNYRILVISNLYPNNEFPRNGVFTEHRIRNMAKSERVRLKVISPVPWFPSRARAFGQYGRYAKVEKASTRHGIQVSYVRFPVIPKIGESVAAILLALALIPTIWRIRREGFDFDLIDAYYFYPDGVAAAILGKIFRRPVVITAYGNDISLIPRHHLPRMQIRWAGRQAGGTTAVCKALRDGMMEIGIPGERSRVVLHGVDFERFKLLDDRAAIRKRLGIEGKTLLSIGHLIERKGHHFAVSALKALPDVSLILIGDGEESENLKALAEKEGVSDRVRFLGHIDQEELPAYYNAVDALVLASSREGIANVLMESLACGTPVVATAVWGAPEVITSPVAGVLIHERSADGVAQGVTQLLANPPNRHETAAFVSSYTWDNTTTGHLELLDEIFAER